jgi:NAD(P)-dependent dehydrogenase (short-subunit alcohol dehydrogenase family)
MSRKMLVVGAAGGVGLEVTKQMVAAGHTVTATVLNDAEETTLRAAVAGVHNVIRLDLSNSEGVREAIRGAVSALDAVAVCAAMGPVGPLEIMPIALVRKTLEVNTVSHVAIYQACMPLLRPSKGRIVFISSFSGKVALPFVGAYSGSKFALEGFGDVMRREAAPFGVRISLVEPGGINTPMVKGQSADASRDRAALSDEMKVLYGPLYDTYLKVFQHASGGLTPAQVAEVVVEAATVDQPAARYVVGEDAKFMCQQVAAMPDAQADETLAGFLKSLG